MNTGRYGTFAISWSQTVTDGIEAAPTRDLRPGSSWMWHGEAVRLDVTHDILVLTGAEEMVDLQRRASRIITAPGASDMRAFPASIFDGGASQAVPGNATSHDVIVTDGRGAYGIRLIRDAGPGGGTLAVFDGEIAPEGTAMWVVHMQAGADHSTAPSRKGGGICVGADTFIDTPGGARRLDDLRPGDVVCTLLRGQQPIAGLTTRRMSGARLFAMPWLRPLRLRPDAFPEGSLGTGHGRMPDLILGPDHCVLLKSGAITALFGDDSALVALRDLEDGRRVLPDTTSGDAVFIDLHLHHHDIVTLNGIGAETAHSDHFDGADAADGQAEDRVVRKLTSSEVAILLHRFGG